MYVTIIKHRTGYVIKADVPYFYRGGILKLNCLAMSKKQALKRFRARYNLKYKHFTIIEI